MKQRKHPDERGGEGSRTVASTAYWGCRGERGRERGTSRQRGRRRAGKGADGEKRTDFTLSRKPNMGLSLRTLRS